MSLDIDSEKLRDEFGTPAHSSSSAQYFVYDYNELNNGEFGWSFVFDRSVDRVVCVTRRYAAPQDLSSVFPAVSTERRESRGAAALRRPLDAQRVLIGIGSQQLVLMRPEAVKQFLPWLAA